uniref:Uncharacterized protein n=1 Tax=Romanomermis culicivorax TaxID=13658 RepID=A0A915L8V3_ROMCU
MKLLAASTTNALGFFKEEYKSCVFSYAFEKPDRFFYNFWTPTAVIVRSLILSFFRFLGCIRLSALIITRRNDVVNLFDFQRSAGI